MSYAKYAKLVGVIAVFALIAAALIGYVMNIIDTITLVITDAPITALFVGRVVGIFVPFIGAVLGYF